MAEVANALDGLVARLVSEPPDGAGVGTTPPAGVAVAVHARGVRSTAAAGQRGDGVALTAATHHDLSSVTKIVATTTALLGLVSDGLVALDAPLVSYVPSFVDSSVTLRHVLQHRGGLAEWWPLYMNARTHAEAVDLAAAIPLAFPPGTSRHYSDLGFLLLGHVIEVATQSTLADAFDELVASPLGLTATRYGQPAGDDVATSALDDRVEQTMIDTGSPYPVPFSAHDFAGWRTGPIAGSVNDGNAFHACGGVAGHAGLFSTLGDLITWGLAMSTASGPWKHDVLAEFLAPGPDPEQSLGLRRYHLRQGGEDVVMFGHPGFVGCAVGFVPDRAVAVALAANRLVTDGDPVPTDLMWRQLLDTVREISS